MISLANEYSNIPHYETVKKKEQRDKCSKCKYNLKKKYSNFPLHPLRLALNQNEKKKKKTYWKWKRLILCVFLKLSILHSVHMPGNNHAKTTKYWDGGRILLSEGSTKMSRVDHIKLLWGRVDSIPLRFSSKKAGHQENSDFPLPVNPSSHRSLWLSYTLLLCTWYH